MHTRLLQVDGLQFEAVTAGPASGELVILLHGFPESGDAWQQQVPALAGAGLRVVAPHQRGYAGSSKPAGLLAYRLSVLSRDVLTLADTLGAAQFSLVGHDWGAAIAWNLVTLHPDRVRHAVILNGPHTGTVGAHSMRHPVQLLRSWYIGAFQLPLLPEFALRANDFALLRRAMEASANHRAIPSELLDTYQDQWSRPGALTAMLNWYRAIALEPPTPARQIDVPVTVVWGEKDRFLDRGLADAALALCSNGRLVPLPNATHWLHHEQPQEVKRALLEALA
ncbi:MAG: Epoxide hydrolase [uncultured Ramlibacter sp.]|uniref:Epoxide hydrolase n=1 Tax=uncultured Ramlibacter sp. TaxID=260755 RepID=A0A6J4PCL6_9BURK|nr:MAG: Epoxide hydrolase [uncultured Ramlibacter sp.]